MFLLFCIPQNALCSSNHKATDVLNKVQSGDQSGLLNIFTVQKNTYSSFIESKKLIKSLIKEMNEQYKLSLTMSDACRLIRENLYLMNIPSELYITLLSTIQQIETETSSNSVILANESYHDLGAKIDILGRSVYWPWEWNWFGLNKKHHKTEFSSHLAVNSQTLELELPPKMAAGFICALGGALICIIPGGQAAGLTLIGAGISLALDGMANGEKPYYVDSMNGKKAP